MIVTNGLKSAGAWLKDRENQKNLANLAINVTLFVLGGRDKKTEILEDVKKIINKLLYFLFCACKCHIYTSFSNSSLKL